MSTASSAQSSRAQTPQIQPKEVPRKQKLLENKWFVYGIVLFLIIAILSVPPPEYASTKADSIPSKSQEQIKPEEVNQKASEGIDPKVPSSDKGVNPDKNV